MIMMCMARSRCCEALWSTDLPRMMNKLIEKKSIELGLNRLAQLVSNLSQSRLGLDPIHQKSGTPLI